MFRTRAGVSLTLVVLCTGVWLPARRARALDLVWEAPETCPDRDAIAARIQRRRGTNEDAGWSVQARVTRTRSHYTLDLTLRGPNQHVARRLVTAVSCAALAETTQIMVALAIESADQAPVEPEGPAAISGSEPPATSQAQAAPAAKVAKVAAPLAARARPAAAPPPAVSTSRPLLRFELGASLALRAGMLLGGPRLGVRPEFALHVGRLRAALAGAWWSSAESQAHAYPRARVDDQALGAELALGVDLTQTRFKPRPSIGLELGQIALKTSGISAPADVHASWLALGVGMQLEVALLAGSCLNVEAFGFAPIGRTQFLLQTPRGTIELFTPSRLGVRASLGVAYAFQ